MAGHYSFFRRPAAVGFVSNIFMSSCLICLIAREIFLLQSDCQCGLLGDNKSA